MKRREFMTLLAVVAGWPMAAGAQQPVRMPRIGVLMGFPESDLQAQSYIAAFRDGLQKLGWTDGRNLRIDTRWATPACVCAALAKIATNQIARQATERMPFPHCVGWASRRQCA